MGAELSVIARKISSTLYCVVKKRTSFEKKNFHLFRKKTVASWKNYVLEFLPREYDSIIPIAANALLLSHEKKTNFWKIHCIIFSGKNILQHGKIVL